LLPVFLFAAAMIGSSHALAAAKQCRFIQAKPEREACYQRQEIALAARQRLVMLHGTIRLVK
jgi:hypothetical protein